MNKLLSFIFFLAILTINELTATELILELKDARNITLPGDKEPQTTVFSGESFGLKVTAKNSDDNTGDFKIKGIEKLKVLGKSSSSNIVMINGKFNADKSHNYEVCSETEGTFEIGPAEVQQNGGLIRSNTLHFRVIKRPENFKEKNAGSKSSSENFAECEFVIDKKNVFMGEPITAILKIKCHGQIQKVSMEPIQFKGFQAKELEQVERKENIKNNKPYIVFEKKYYLIPLEKGSQKIGPATVIYHVPEQQRGRARGMFNDDFFNFGGFFDQVRLVQKRALSNSIQLKVTDPNEIQSETDGVGKFSKFQSSVDKTSALLNEAIKLTLEIEGEGNFEQIMTPKLKLEPFIKNYESKTDFTENPSNGPFAGKKTFEFIIQVGKTGEIIIPAQKFAYLDTETKKVKTLESKPITLQILQPTGEQASTVKSNFQPTTDQQAKEEQAPEKEQSQEINFIEQEGLVTNKKDWMIPWWLLIILLAMPAFFYTKIASKMHTYLNTTTIFKHRSKKALLKKIVLDFEKIKENKKPEQLYSFFLHFLGIKFDLNLQEISHDKISVKLADMGFDGNKINEFSDFLNDCASLHFIKNSNRIDTTIGASLLKKSEYWIILLTK